MGFLSNVGSALGFGKSDAEKANEKEAALSKEKTNAAVDSASAKTSTLADSLAEKANKAKVTNQVINAPERVGEGQITAPKDVNANVMQSAKVGQAGQMNAAQVKQAADAMAAKGTAAQINMQQANAQQGNQNQLISALQQQMAGKGPSLAQGQLKQATDRGIAQQMAMAASTGNSPLGARQAMQNQAQIQQQAAADSAQTRIQEQQAATSQLGNAIEGARSQDINLATTQAGMEQQTGIANLSNEQQTELANMAKEQQTLMEQAGMDQEAMRINNANEQATKMAQAGFDQQTIIANETNRLTALTGNRDTALAIATGNAQRAQAAQQFNSQANTAVQTQNAANDMAAQQATISAQQNYANQAMGGYGSLASNALAVNQQQQAYNQAGITRDANKNKALVGTIADVAGMAAGLPPGTLSKAFSGGSAPTVPGVTQTTALPSPTSAAGIQAPAPTFDQFMASDEKLKKNIEPIKPDLIEGLKAYTYQYKDPKFGEGQQNGVIAQDLEKVRPDAVVDTPEGKMVNYGKLMPDMLAGLIGQNDKVKMLEEALKNRVAVSPK